MFEPFSVCLFRGLARSATLRRNTPGIVALRNRHFPIPKTKGFHAAPKHSPSSEFEEVPLSQEIEEELVPGYASEKFYPVSIGEILDARYQVVTKLGRGVGSTAWLARDLQQGGHRTLKVCTRSGSSGTDQQADNELAVSAHLQTSPVQQHPGRPAIRVVLDSFQVDGPHGTHKCLVYQPLGMSFTEFRNLLPQKRFEKRMLQHSMQLLCIALDYLHKNKVVHTDISPNNILISGADQSVLERMEEDEKAQPIARKSLADRTIYMSRPFPVTEGTPVICDLGSARMGHDSYKGDVMPDTYRAPEVILGMEWSSKVDVWSLGVMIWDLFEEKRLFFTRKNGVLNDEQHLAEMVALLGNPPAEFLRRSSKCSLYWDAEGNWVAPTPIPEQSFEMRESSLDGEDKELLLAFVRSMLTWLPEERPTAEELAYDDFLMQAYFARKDGQN